MTRNVNGRRSGAASRTRTSNRSTRSKRSTGSKRSITKQQRSNIQKRMQNPAVRSRLQQKVQPGGENKAGQTQGTPINDGAGLLRRRKSEGARGRFMRRFLGIRNPRTQPNVNTNTNPTPKPVNNEPAPKPVNTQPAPKPVNNEPAPKPVNNNHARTPVNTDPAPKPVNAEPAPKPVNAEPAPKPVENQNTGLTPEEILTGWKQGGQKNCVTVGGIKAAQAMYGAELANAEHPDRGIFKSAERTDAGGLNITMRDGFKIELSKKELETAAKYSGFRLNKSDDKALLQNAHEVFAAAGKRAQIEGNDGKRGNTMSYTQALRTLNNGEDTYRVSEHFGRLGLKNHTEKVTRNELKDHTAWISRTPGHAYMGTEDARDYYGKSGNVGKGSNFGYVLKPITLEVPNTPEVPNTNTPN